MAPLTMIGVIVNPADHDVVREFFELFKTPWELYRPDRRYPVVLAAGAEPVGGVTAGLLLRFAGDALPEDAVAGRPGRTQPAPSMLTYRDTRIPLYGPSVSFPGDDLDLQDDLSGRSVAYVRRHPDRVLVRIGYDLFAEIRRALTVGQPPANAGLPSVERHIGLVRDLIVEWAAPLVEVPPVPDGYPFLVCLTHDVDHPAIRRHPWDHTIAGFLYRALLGSLVDLLRGRAPARRLRANWAAVATLPFIHLGLARDFWDTFDRYLELEAGRPSTFFVVPFAGDPGRTPQGPAPRHRASRYGAADIAGRIRTVLARGGEVGVHGIDAWHDSAKGRQELDEVARITGAQDTGVRMHWLYTDGDAAATLDKAGFAYDASGGYNDTVGYRAGTTQVFKPLDAVRLLELPLHVMDTALLFPRRLGLSAAAARARGLGLIDGARRLGGVLTINWHDRSIAPERLWGDVYVDLIEALQADHPWFTTAGGAVAWFRQRRSVVFETVTCASGEVRATLAADLRTDLPGLRLRVHPGGGGPAHRDHRAHSPRRAIDVPVRAGTEMVVRL